MKKVKNSWGIALFMLCFLLTTGRAYALPTSGTGSMTSLADALSNPSVSTSGIRHNVTFDPFSTSAIDRVELTIHTPTDAPASAAIYNAVGASLTSQTLWSGGTYSTNVSSNVITVTRNEGAAVPTAGVRALVLDGLTNPSTLGTYYITVATQDGGTYVDAGTTSFLLSTPASINATVDPFFSFAVSENGVKDNSSDSTGDVNITLGGIVASTASHPSTGGGIDGHLLTVTTNAPNGYVVTVQDTANGLALVGGTVNSSMRTVDDATAPQNPVIFDYSGNSLPASGTEAFYFTLSGTHIANTLSTYNSLLGAVAKTIISSSTSVTNDVHEILFNAQSHADTVAGTYSDTITYTATPNF